MGVSADSNTDMQVIMDGGENFVARMTAYSNAKKAAEDAVTELNLTKTGLAYADEQKALLEDAKKVKADADKALADAKDLAEKIAADARSQSAQVISAANIERVRLVAEAQTVKSQADAALAYANEMKMAANQALLDIDRQKRAVQASADDMAAKVGDLDAAKAEAQAMKAKFETLIGRINAVASGV